MSARVYNISRRARTFAPSMLGENDGTRLEHRSMAAPAFYRLALANEVPPADESTAAVLGITIVNDSSATQTGSVTTTDGAGTTFTLAGTANSSVTDVSDPGTGSTVGNSTISMTASAQIHMTTSGPSDSMFNTLDARGTVARTYTIADDGPTTPTTPATLVEHFTSSYTPLPYYPDAFQMGSRVATPSLTVDVVGYNSGITGVYITGADGTTWSFQTGYTGTGTLTPPTMYGTPGYSIDYNLSTTSVDVTAHTNIGILPLTGRNPSTGNPTGIAFPVGFGCSVGGSALSAPGVTADTSATASYTASF